MCAKRVPRQDGPRQDGIVRIVLAHYPDVQAIYLFGTYGTDQEWPDSDVDIALLLPPAQARHQPRLALTPCHTALARWTC